ncbi:MAG: isopenicillin N synthase family oxygenase, partial [Luminiphilus sp.]
MKDSHEISLEVGLPVASISSEEHLAFASDSDLEVAWDLGLFYLKTPDELDLESARQFGKDLIATDSPYRKV